MSNPNFEVVLPLGASAEKYTCGSCAYFGRTGRGEYENNGLCALVLPKHYLRQPYDPESREPNTVADTDRCDLWKGDGKTYIVSQRIKP